MPVEAGEDARHLSLDGGAPGPGQARVAQVRARQTLHHQATAREQLAGDITAVGLGHGEPGVGPVPFQHALFPLEAAPVRFAGELGHDSLGLAVGGQLDDAVDHAPVEAPHAGDGQIASQESAQQAGGAFRADCGGVEDHRFRSCRARAKREKFTGRTARAQTKLV